MPIHIQDVEPTVVVNIEESAPPTKQSGIGYEPGGLGVVLKHALAVVVVKIGKVVREICLEDIQQPIAVVIARGNPHTRLIATIAAGRHAGFQTSFSERAIAIV